MSLFDILRGFVCPDTQKLLFRIKELECNYGELAKQLNYAEVRAVMLAKAMVGNLTVPLASGFTKPENAKTYYPFMDVVLDKYASSIADAEYLSFPKQQWVNLLTPIQRIVKETLGEWTTNISDCDDFALVMNSYVAVSFIKGGFSKQGAFLTLWSKTHAYNGFVDSTEVIWVYEPQNNKIVGKLTDTKAPYDTEKVWVPGLKSSLFP